MTPMMQQYFEIKNQYRDYILFYRLGDFYEMFFEDAQLVSAELELTLTGRACGDGERAPMCGPITPFSGLTICHVAADSLKYLNAPANSTPMSSNHSIVSADFSKYV